MLNLRTRPVPFPPTRDMPIAAAPSPTQRDLQESPRAKGRPRPTPTNEQLCLALLNAAECSRAIQASKAELHAAFAGGPPKGNGELTPQPQFLCTDCIELAGKVTQPPSCFQLRRRRSKLVTTANPALQCQAAGGRKTKGSSSSGSAWLVAYRPWCKPFAWGATANGRFFLPRQGC